MAAFFISHSVWMSARVSKRPWSFEDIVALLNQ